MCCPSSPYTPLTRYLVASTQPPPMQKTTPLIEALIAEKSAQRDKEAILRNHAHYTIAGPNPKDKKKAGPAPPPKAPGGDLGKKAAKKAAAAAKAQKAAPASSKAQASTPAPPTIMTKHNGGANSAVKSPPRAPRPPKLAMATAGGAPTNPASAGATPSSSMPSSSSAVTTVAPAPARRARPVIGMASRQFEVALNGAGVKSKRGGKEREKDDAGTSSEVKAPQAGGKPHEEYARIDAPSAQDDLVGAGGAIRGAGRGRGRGRGRGANRGG